MLSFNVSRLAKTAAAVCVAAGMTGAGISTADAKPTADLLTNVAINGTAVDVNTNTSSTLTGTATITGIEFDSTSGNLVFTGTIAGVATDGSITTDILNQIFSTTGSLTGSDSGKGKCDILNLDLGPLNLDLLGLTVDLSEVELDIAAVRGPGRLLGNLLCQLTRILDSGNMEQINKQLGRINSIIGSGLENVAVTGSLLDGGSFTGFLTIESLAVDDEGNVLITGVLNGVAVGDNLTTTVLNQAFSTTGTLSGISGDGKGKKCSILSLDLGPINLDLLGLQIDLSEVMLDLGGKTGTGKLLGNLLCTLARTLDDDNNGNLEKTLKKLTKSVQKINQELLR